MTFLEVHIIQTLPPSNPNRDDKGHPKTILYGNTQRYRLSSQSQKRAARLHYSQYSDLDRAHFASRSRRHHVAVTQMVMASRPDADEDTVELASRIVLAALNSNPESILKGLTDPDGSNMLFLAQYELEMIAKIVDSEFALLSKMAAHAAEYLAIEDKAKRKDFKKHPTAKDLKPVTSRLTKELTSQTPGDVALFGRMMATLSDVSVDGCLQVAHAISVNSTRRSTYMEDNRTRYTHGEPDFFTAVDDIKYLGDSRGGHLGTVVMASPTYYRYANICLSELERLVGDKDVAKEFAKAFIRSFVETLPTGHQTSMAHGCRPEMVLLQRRRDCPYSLLAAFEKPLEYSGGISADACGRLLEHHKAMLEMYGDRGIESTSITALPECYCDGVSLDQAIDKTMTET